MRSKLFAPNAGLTLVELLIALAISGFVSVIGYEVMVFMGAASKASLEQRHISEFRDELVRLTDPARVRNSPEAQFLPGGTQPNPVFNSGLGPVVYSVPLNVGQVGTVALQTDLSTASQLFQKNTFAGGVTHITLGAGILYGSLLISDLSVRPISWLRTLARKDSAQFQHLYLMELIAVVERSEAQLGSSIESKKPTTITVEFVAASPPTTSAMAPTNSIAFQMVDYEDKQLFDEAADACLATGGTWVFSSSTCSRPAPDRSNDFDTPIAIYQCPPSNGACDSTCGGQLYTGGPRSGHSCVQGSGVVDPVTARCRAGGTRQTVSCPQGGVVTAVPVR